MRSKRFILLVLLPIPLLLTGALAVCKYISDRATKLNQQKEAQVRQREAILQMQSEEAELENALRTHGFRCHNSWFGADRWVSSAIADSRRPLNPESLKLLQGFSHLESVAIARGSNPNGDGLEFLNNIPTLRSLLVNVRLTNDGLARVNEIANLRQLEIRSSNITDEGLVHLKNLRFLERLSLEAPSITNSGLRHLEKLTQLKFLILLDTQVDEHGAAGLKVILPDLTIVFHSSASPAD